MGGGEVEVGGKTGGGEGGRRRGREEIERGKVMEGERKGR